MEEILSHNEMELMSSISGLQKSIFIQTEHLSEQLTKKLHHLEDYNSPIDEPVSRRIRWKIPLLASKTAWK